MRRPPRWKAGAMDSEMTHMTGYGDAVRTERPFQAMNGVLRLRRTGSVLVKRARNRKEAEKARFILGCDLYSSLLTALVIVIRQVENIKFVYPTQQSWKETVMTLLKGIVR
jgi:hypothetical protein